jgi:hypothetical protein
VVTCVSTCVEAASVFCVLWVVDCWVFAWRSDRVPVVLLVPLFAESAVEELEALFDGACDWRVELLRDVRRLPEADALPEPLRLPEALLELEGAAVVVWSRSLRSIDEEVPLAAFDPVDDDGVEIEEEELPDAGAVLLPDDVVLDESLVPDPDCGRVEVWACRHKAAANRAGVPARMNFNGRFMVMISRLVPDLPRRVRFTPGQAMPPETGGKAAGSRRRPQAANFGEVRGRRLLFPPIKNGWEWKPRLNRYASGAKGNRVGRRICICREQYASFPKHDADHQLHTAFTTISLRPGGFGPMKGAVPLCPMRNVFCCFSLLLLSPAVAASAKDAAMTVAASRELRIAIVDSSKATPARESMYQAFAAALSEAFSAHAGTVFGVRLKAVGADHAAFNLESGVYDAVFVPSATLPRPLIISGLTRLAGKRGSGVAQQTVHLVFNPSDQKFTELLTASFPEALQSPKFIESLSEPKGAMVAVRGN